MYDRKKIGQRLVKLRGDKSQEQAAKDLKVTYTSYRKYESGERIPRDELKIKIAKYYGKTVQEIFF